VVKYRFLCTTNISAKVPKELIENERISLLPHLGTSTLETHKKVICSAIMSVQTKYIRVPPDGTSCAF